MTPLSYNEISDLAGFIELHLAGAQLQSAWTSQDLLVLEFYKLKNIFIICDLQNSLPFLCLTELNPVKNLGLKKEKKPLGLFIEANVCNQHLQNVETNQEWGRVLRFHFRESTVLEFRLIPRAVNFLVTAEGKKIAWRKPQDLPSSQIQLDGKTKKADWPNLFEEWIDTKWKPKKESLAAKDPSQIVRALEKKRSALEKIEFEINSATSAKEWDVFREIGESLKLPDFQIPKELKTHFRKTKRSEQIQEAFELSRQVLRKHEGRIERAAKLKNEIENWNPEEFSASNSNSGKRLKDEGPKTRKLNLGDGLEVLMGKSAKDNLSLLRQAKPWDLWLHLRDYPSAHAILRRNRQVEVSDSKIQKAVDWVCQEHFKGQKIDLGQKIEVIIAECRHVKPLKGDNHGRVTYQHGRIFISASRR